MPAPNDVRESHVKILFSLIIHSLAVKERDRQNGASIANRWNTPNDIGEFISVVLHYTDTYTRSFLAKHAVNSRRVKTHINKHNYSNDGRIVGRGRTPGCTHEHIHN